MPVKIKSLVDGSLEVRNGLGTVVLTIDTAGEITDINGEGFLGKGQTFQNVMASRAYNTVYTNTTNKEIWIVSSAQMSGSDRINMVVDGVIINTLRVDVATGGFFAIYGIVQPGSTYELDTSATPSMQTWFELR